MIRFIATVSVMFLIFVILSCTRGTPDYDKAYLDMPLEEFLSLFGEAEKIQEVPNSRGSKFVEYSLPSYGAMKRASYFFVDQSLDGIVIVYGKGQDHHTLVSQLTEKHGKPILNKTIDNSKGVNWRKPDAYITLLHGIRGTKIKLPVGETDELSPEETMLIIGKRRES